MAEKMSNAEYRQKEGISASDLKKMVKSMAYYHYCKENPEDSDTEALLFGRAYHKLMLEPEDFDTEFAVAPYVDKRTKEGKATWQKFCEENEGKDIITQQTYETLLEMQKALYETPYVKLLIKGDHEKSYFWVDENYGLPMKIRPDSTGKIKDEYICIDLKTTVCAETDKFMRDSIRLGYDLQASHYLEGLEKTYGKKFKFIFIAQEKTAPYLVNVLEADEYFIQSGKELRDMLLQQYVECSESGNWYGYMKDGINSLGVPKWIEQSLMMNNEEEGEFE